jgi:hypothetical protein
LSLRHPGEPVERSFAGHGHNEAVISVDGAAACRAPFLGAMLAQG